MDPSDLELLRHLLVCPVCKGRLDFVAHVVTCTSCSLRFQQAEEGYVDLLPNHLLDREETRWGERQQQTEEWYRNLITNPPEAGSCFVRDYTPYAPLLATFAGLILDVGGGNGVVRHFLPRQNVRYVVIDPSTEWLQTEWSSIAERFPCLRAMPCFVRGIVEYLPFLPQSFDAVLSFWSLNHSNEPDRGFREVHHVLRPGGRFLIVLEDMEPRWRDIPTRTFATKGMSHMAGLCRQKLQCSLRMREWPVQSDHLRIRESQIRRWTSGRFAVTRRAWIGEYLTFELRRL